VSWQTGGHSELWLSSESIPASPTSSSHSLWSCCHTHDTGWSPTPTDPHRYSTSSWHSAQSGDHKSPLLRYQEGNDTDKPTFIILSKTPEQVVSSQHFWKGHAMRQGIINSILGHPGMSEIIYRNFAIWRMITPLTGSYLWCKQSIQRK